MRFSSIAAAPYALWVFSVQCEVRAPPRRSKFLVPLHMKILPSTLFTGQARTSLCPSLSMKRSATAASRSSRPERSMNSRLRTPVASPSLFNQATSSKAAARIVR